MGLQDGHVQKHLMVELHRLKVLLLDQLVNLREKTLAVLVQLHQIPLFLGRDVVLLLLLVDATTFLPAPLAHFLGNHPHFLCFLLVLAEEIEVAAGMEVLETALAQIDRFFLEGTAAPTNPVSPFGSLDFRVIGEAKRAILRGSHSFRGMKHLRLLDDHLAHLLLFLIE